MWPLLLLATLARPASAAPGEVRPLAVQLGLGGRYGAAGAAVTWRFHPQAAAVVGAGYWGVGGGVRGCVWRSLYLQAGASPLAATADRSLVLYGPDLTAGVDLRGGRLSFTAGAGAGVLGLPASPRLTPTLDLGLGVNLGPARELP